MRYLHLISSMDPRAGGPCQGIRNLTPRSHAAGHSVEVVCLDDPDSAYLAAESRDAGARSQEPRAASGEPRGQQTVVRGRRAEGGGHLDKPSTCNLQPATLKIHALGKGRGAWSYHPALKPWLENNLPRFDAVILNGLWQYPGFVMSQLARKLGDQMPPYFVFPHGMLDPWFQRAPERRWKAVRNWVYWKLIERHVIARAAAVFFTCAEEMRLAQKTFRPYRPQQQVNVGYGISEPPEFHERMVAAFAEKCPGLEGRPYFLYLSRIHPKKGVDLLIQAYARVYGEAAASRESRAASFEPAASNSSLVAPRCPLPATPALVIAGPGLDTAYGQQMQRLAAKLCPPTADHGTTGPQTTDRAITKAESGKASATNSISASQDFSFSAFGATPPSADSASPPSPLRGEGRGEVSPTDSQFSTSCAAPPSSNLPPPPQERDLPLAHQMGEGGAERRVRAAESLPPSADSAVGGQLSESHPPSSILPPRPQIFFPGMLTGDAKWGALYRADAFVLTSHQENFGIAVVEALACASPVLISNQINIWREIEQEQAGLVAPDTLAGAEQLFRRWESLTYEARVAMTRAAQGSYMTRFGVGNAAQNLLDTMEALVAEHKKVESRK